MPQATTPGRRVEARVATGPTRLDQGVKTSRPVAPATTSSAVNRIGSVWLPSQRCT